MEYFLVKPNPDYSDAPRFLDFHKKINMNDFYFNRSYGIPKRTLIRIHPNEHMDFTDYLFQSVPLFTDTAMQVIWKYDSDFIHKEVILLSTQDSIDKLYYLPFFQRFPSSVILEPSSVYLIERPDTVPLLKLPYSLPVFFVFLDVECMLFMRLDLVESLLRKGARGLSLRKTICFEEV